MTFTRSRRYLVVLAVGGGCLAAASAALVFLDRHLRAAGIQMARPVQALDHHLGIGGQMDKYTPPMEYYLPKVVAKDST